MFHAASYTDNFCVKLSPTANHKFSSRTMSFILLIAASQVQICKAECACKITVTEPVIAVLI